MFQTVTYQARISPPCTGTHSYVRSTVTEAGRRRVPLSLPSSVHPCTHRREGGSPLLPLLSGAAEIILLHINDGRGRGKGGSWGWRVRSSRRRRVIEVYLIAYLLLRTYKEEGTLRRKILLRRNVKPEIGFSGFRHCGGVSSSSSSYSPLDPSSS